LALTRQVTATFEIALEAREVVVVAPAPLFVFFATERFESHATVGPDGLVFGGRFEDGFSNRYGHSMFASALLIGIRWTGAVTRDTALDVNRVGVFLGVFMRAVDYLYVAVTEKPETERLPLGAFLYPFVALKYL
jgi:hypothetical protein